MTARPCLDCGQPTPDGTRCTDCAPSYRTHERSASARGYDASWQRLSRQARRLQPWCLDCGATTDLTTDHSAEAWRRHERGLPVRLGDVAVVCRGCNSRRGAARHAGQVLDTRGETPLDQRRRPPGKAKFVSHTEGPAR